MLKQAKDSRSAKMSNMLGLRGMDRIKNFSPKKSLGQHFLKDVAAIRRIVAAVPELGHFMEIGPGPGALTEILLQRCNELVLVEKDDQFASYWLQRAETEPRLTLVHADILKALEEIMNKYSPEWIVGNLPYNISGPLTAKLAGLEPFRGMVLMYQREVAERLLAGPGSKVYGGLSVLTRHHYRVSRLLTLAPGAFSPPPKVHSSVLLFQPHGENPICSYQDLQKTVRHGFSHRRKTIANNFRGLISLEQWEQLEIDPIERPEGLSYSAWVRITQLLQPQGSAE